ncbi:hypothetical protein HYX08_01435 [Candidatus Woesearchaeota archaeon]|nr:hypothetical protein [Candidatus Woesearchaeota archaeon]
MGKMRRKGIFFTFIAIIIMAAFILVFTPQADISIQKDTLAAKTRITTIDNYVSDLENSYFENVLRATSYKAILSLIFYMNSTGSYIADLDSAFSEVILTGNINGVPIDSITGKQIMGNSTLNDWNARMIAAAKDTLNVNTTINVLSVSVSQSRPWNIDSRIEVNFTVKSNVAEWSKKSAIISSISIGGLYDPYYLVNTNKAYTNQIKRSTVEFNQWNIGKVREHVRNGTYVHFEGSDAPSFLMRLTNNMSASACCGIESYVNPNMVGPPDQIDSYADYHLWSNKFANNCTQLYNITGIWDEFRYFKLDFDHLTLLNITAQDAVRTC